jgi:hypothetical protein
VVVKDQPGFRAAAVLQGHVERALGQVQALVIVHRPAHDASAAGVDQCGEVQRSFARV